MNNIICIDIGGTAIKYGVINTEGDVQCTRETPTEAKKGAAALTEKLRHITRELLAECPDARGIAISTAGVVNSDEASILHATDAIPGWKGTSLRNELAEFSLPVEAENDVNCAGLAEYISGNAQGAKSALVMTIGTGIGGCYIEEGRLLNGHTYSACEVGYLPVDGTAFQDLAATSVLSATVAAVKGGTPEEWTGRRIFEAAAAGDTECREAIDTMCEILGKGIAALCFVLNPEVVVLGGGIMAQEAVLRSPIETAFAQHSIPLVADAIRIEFASHQNAAGMKGALVNFLNRHPELA